MSPDKRFRWLASDSQSIVDHSSLKNILDYDPLTGEFTWKERRGSVRAGAKAGNVNAAGYWEVQVSGKGYRANRLAWFYVHGVWPKHEVDHINRVKTDNRIDNLRDVPHAVNLANRGGRFVNARGVYLHRGKWAARKVVDGERRWLGYYPSEDAALAALALA